MREVFRLRFKGKRLLSLERESFNKQDGQMSTGVGAILGALLAIYQALPLIGINVHPLPDTITGSLVALIAWAVGLFTKKPPSKDPTKTAVIVAEAEKDHAAALANFNKRSAILHE